MADLTSTTVAANYNKFFINTSDAGHEIIVSATKGGGLTDADLLAVYRQLTLAGGDGTGSDVGGPDAFTVAGVGTADGTALDLDAESEGQDTVAYFRIQGSGGTPKLDAVSGVTLAKVCEFRPAK
jgi:hypothetical protein